MAVDDSRAVVCDFGSGVVKAGFSGDDAPRSVFPTLVGLTPTPQPPGPLWVRQDTPPTTRRLLVGDDAVASCFSTDMRYPITRGRITDWQDMERILEYTFHGNLRLNTAEYRIMLTESPLNPREVRETMTQIMFERFDAPAIHMGIQAVLSLHSTGRTTGVVLDSGDGVTHTVPIYEGYSLPHAILRSDVAGRDLTVYIMKLLSESGQVLRVPLMNVACSIKERLCYAPPSSWDFRTKFTWADDEAFELPDKSVIKVGTPIKCCPEALFEPSHIGSDLDGFHTMTFKSIEKCDVDMHRVLLENIVLSGGTTMFKGLPERLATEMKKLAPLSVTTRVIAPPERRFSAWIGGSILSSLSSFQSRWIHRREYDEEGSRIVHRKCFC